MTAAVLTWRLDLMALSSLDDSMKRWQNYQHSEHGHGLYREIPGIFLGVTQAIRVRRHRRGAAARAGNRTAAAPAGGGQARAPVVTAAGNGEWGPGLLSSQQRGTGTGAAVVTATGTGAAVITATGDRGAGLV